MSKKKQVQNSGLKRVKEERRDWKRFFKTSLLLIGTMVLLPSCGNTVSTQKEATKQVQAVKSVQKKTDVSFKKAMKSQSSSNVEYRLPVKDGLKVYTEEKQTKVKAFIDKQLKNNQYTIKKPLVYYNPFGTNLRSANVYFKTKESYQVEYTISVADKEIKDFTKKLNAGTKSGYTTNHAYQLIGLVPNKKNQITLKLYNRQGKLVKSTSFTIQVPKVSSSAEEQLKVTKAKKVTLTDGLYMLSFGRVGGQLPNINIYDNDGRIRAELPLESYRSDRILQIGNYLYYGVGYSKLVKVNRLGQVVKIYSLGDYTMHHDFTYEKAQNSLIILASKKGDSVVEDLVLQVNIGTGKVKELLDLKDIFPKEYEKAKKPESKKVLDWAHINTVQCVNGTDLILSFRELSSIVKVDNVYTKPKLRSILCDKEVWKGSAYEKYVYTKDGDFTAQAGQHTVTYIEGKTKDKYRLHMFNNNLAYSGTRPDIDWSGYTLAQIPVEKRHSYYYEYEVDENKKEFRLVKSFAVPYSGYISSSEQVGAHYVVCSGSARVFGEYDKNGKLLAQYETSDQRAIYRAFKYNFKGIWFAK